MIHSSHQWYQEILICSVILMHGIRNHIVHMKMMQQELHQANQYSTNHLQKQFALEILVLLIYQRVSIHIGKIGLYRVLINKVERGTLQIEDRIESSLIRKITPNFNMVNGPLFNTTADRYLAQGRFRTGPNASTTRRRYASPCSSGIHRRYTAGTMAILIFPDTYSRQCALRSYGPRVSLLLFADSPTRPSRLAQSYTGSWRTRGRSWIWKVSPTMQ